MESNNSTIDTYHIGIETGGTSCKVGIMKNIGVDNLIHTHHVNTRVPSETMQDIMDYINSFDYTYSSVGIAAFGPIGLNQTSADYGYVTSTPKVEWQNFNLLETVLSGINKKTEDFVHTFDTDVNLVAKFEADFGGHHDAHGNVVYITVGTGIGIGVVLNNQMLHGLVHPEGGHQKVPIHPDDIDYPGVCVFHGNCLEGLCTNVSIAKRKGLDDVELNKDIPNEDPIWDLVGYYLGIACSNIIFTMSAQKIVIGGGVMNREILYDKIRHHCFKSLNGYIKHPKLESEEALKKFIVKSKFENNLGLIAAAMVGSNNPN
eukprot:403360730